jgi:cell surface protein SprA
MGTPLNGHGRRPQLRLRLAALVLSLPIFFGCHDETTEEPTPQGWTAYVQDYNYVQGKYFFIINPNDPSATVGPNNPITSIRLYLDDKDIHNNVELGAASARVWLDPNAETPSTPATGEFHLLHEEQEYTVWNDLGFGFPRIELKNALTPYQTLAVAYIQTVGAVSETVGTWPTSLADSTIVLYLKMLRPSDEEWGPNDLKQSPWASVRYLEAKNVYSLGVHDIEPGTMSVDVVRDIAGTGGQNPDFIDNEFHKRTLLLQVLGLDQLNNFDPTNRTPDQRIDPEYVDLQNGLIFFPDLRPFDPDRADIEGTAARERSWPRSSGVERPDTLGWYKDQGSQGPVPSNAAVRNSEVVPEIYDLKYTELSQTAYQHHIYAIVVTITPISQPE